MNADERMEEMRAEVKRMWMGNNHPPQIDITKSHIARVYDFILRGKDNYEVDRKAAEVLLSRHPALRTMAWVNREFLQRGVTYLAQEAGIDQFIDVGSGHEAPSAPCRRTPGSTDFRTNLPGRGTSESDDSLSPSPSLHGRRRCLGTCSPHARSTTRT